MLQTIHILLPVLILCFSLKVYFFPICSHFIFKIHLWCTWQRWLSLTDNNRNKASLIWMDYLESPRQEKKSVSDENPSSDALETFYYFTLSQTINKKQNKNKNLIIVLIYARSITFALRIRQMCPGWCGSVDWVLACKPKGVQFDSQSGHMPGLWARSPVGGTWEATTHWCFSPTLYPPFPSLKK